MCGVHNYNESGERQTRIRGLKVDPALLERRRSASTISQMLRFIFTFLMNLKARQRSHSKVDDEAHRLIEKLGKSEIAPYWRIARISWVEIDHHIMQERWLTLSWMQEEDADGQEQSSLVAVVSKWGQSYEPHFVADCSAS
ncbi:uncharacterized protein MEPE_04355 [Melanopsichium pennsylvanicum]|uniref:Uncharacterized protein n=1 Tax=Melanopsichium pennsylvanicum TaxID=63383 RepID=A0AAJ4XPQ3_9BASI|nr:uncharacterized protein MEPE_04355 [Melanopsichium pennsylvanicum]